MPDHPMRESLAAYFATSFSDFLTEDSANILTGVSEQNLCGQLAMKLWAKRGEYGIDNYFVDTEYNRNGGELKQILVGQENIISIRCDVIVHSRGTILGQDNLVAVEMKRWSHPNAEKMKDRVRLRALTRSSFDGIWSNDGTTFPKYVCGYVLGYYLELDDRNRSFLLEEYVEGQIEARKRISF